MVKYEQKILDNGLKVILVKLKDTAVISMGFFIKAGSRDETNGNGGVAHFLEHMMFKGTKKRNANKLFQQLDAIGAEYNATTAMEYTYYYLYGNMDNTRELLDITIDMYCNPTFSTKELNKERKVIIEEKRMRFDSPYMHLHSMLEKRIFAGTILAQSAIGIQMKVLTI